MSAVRPFTITRGHPPLPAPLAIAHASPIQTRIISRLRCMKSFSILLARPETVEAAACHAIAHGKAGVGCRSAHRKRRACQHNRKSSRSAPIPHCNIMWQKFDDHCHRCQRLSREVGIMNEQPNTTDQSQDQEESAYSLLIRSEEKSRNAFELIMYPCMILGPLIAIWQFAHHPVNIPAAGVKGPRDIVLDVSAQNNICRDEFYTLRRRGYPEIKG